MLATELVVVVLFILVAGRLVRVFLSEPITKELPDGA
jgi:hypothetical protein